MCDDLQGEVTKPYFHCLIPRNWVVPKQPSILRCLFLMIHMFHASRSLAIRWQRIRKNDAPVTTRTSIAHQVKYADMVTGGSAGGGVEGRSQKGRNRSVVPHP